MCMCTNRSTNLIKCLNYKSGYIYIFKKLCVNIVLYVVTLAIPHGGYRCLLTKTCQI